MFPSLSNKKSRSYQAGMKKRLKALPLPPNRRHAGYDRGRTLIRSPQAVVCYYYENRYYELIYPPPHPRGNDETRAQRAVWICRRRSFLSLSLSLRLGVSLCGCKIPMIDCYFIPLLSAVNSALPLTDDTFARLSIMGSL